MAWRNKLIEARRGLLQPLKNDRSQQDSISLTFRREEDQSETSVSNLRGFRWISLFTKHYTYFAKIHGLLCTSFSITDSIILLQVAVVAYLVSTYYWVVSLYTQCCVGLGLPWWPADKESACNAGDTGDTGSIPGSGRSPGGGNGNPFQYSCLQKSHGQRSLAGYSEGGDGTQEYNVGI